VAAARVNIGGDIARTTDGSPIEMGIPFEGVPELDLRDERAAETSREAYIQDHRMDIYRLPGIGSMLRWRWLQPVIEVPMLAVFVLAIIVGIWGTQEPSQNLATMLIWVYWWSLIIFSFIFVGRIWCMICPLGAAGEWTNRRVGTLGWSWPRALRNLWIAHIFFIVLTGVDLVIGIDILPRFTGIFLLSLLVMSVGMALLFERRAFCRYVCPIGGMCGIYSMTSTVELRVKSRGRCESCTTKECIKGTDASYACSWFEYPGEMDRNNYCTICGECDRSCPHDNVGLSVRPPGQDLWRTNKRVFDEVILAVGLIGVMASHTIATTQPYDDWVTGLEVDAGIPAWVTITLVYVFSIILANMAYFAVSRLAASTTSTPDRRLDGRTVYRWTGYALIPLALSMHLARNVTFLNIWGTAIFDVMANMFNPPGFPFGTGPVETQDLLPDSTMWWIRMAIILLGFIFSAYAAYRLSLRMQPRRREAGKMLAAILIAMVAFSIVYVWILSLPLVA
jgi:polyferredoxin